MLVSLLVVSVAYLTGCDDDDDDDSAKSEKTYTLDAASNSGVSGTVNFTKQNDQTTVITIQLSGTEAGNSHPAHIHSGVVTPGAPIVLDLTSVDGSTGQSVTTVTKLNDGTAVTDEDLIAFDGT